MRVIWCDLVRTLLNQTRHHPLPLVYIVANFRHLHNETTVASFEQGVLTFDATDLVKSGYQPMERVIKKLTFDRPSYSYCQNPCICPGSNLFIFILIVILI